MDDIKAEIENKFMLPERFKGLTIPMWDEYSELTETYNSVSLGEGFPDFLVPESITKVLQQIEKEENALVHQYTRASGHARLVKALSNLYSELIGRPIDPATEILISNGATGALYASICGNINNGDEVIIIEPAFNAYEPMVRVNGGVPVFVPLRLRSSSEITSSADWGLDPEELQQAFSQRTKAIIFNNPHNPYGKVFSEDEMLLISQLCEKWNVLCISDEVYEWLVYEPRKHIRIATLPGMWERTVTIGSAGKTFNVTGWKIGWTYGPHKLMYNIQFAQNNTVNVCNTPLQEALAIGLERELNRLHHSSCLFTSLLPTLETRKTYMVQLLVSLGLNPIIPEAGFFIVADCSSLATKVDLSSENDKCLDVRFTKWLIKNVGVVTIPCSEFYNEENKHIGEHLIRMCFIKKKTTVEAFGEKLIKWKAGLPE